LTGGLGRKALARKPVRPRKRAKLPGISIPGGWKLDRGGKSLSLHVETKDFLEAVALINVIAPIAEETEHHPDFHLEQWNKLRITTYSHDVGKLTERDERLAKRISELLKARGLL
jgi:4a-hydroxytetrahydrobiopterin dehydratase